MNEQTDPLATARRYERFDDIEHEIIESIQAGGGLSAVGRYQAIQGNAEAARRHVQRILGRPKKIVMTDFATAQLLHSVLGVQAALEANDFDNLDPDQLSDVMMNLDRLWALMDAITSKAGVDLEHPPEEFIEGSVDVLED